MHRLIIPTLLLVVVPGCVDLPGSGGIGGMTIVRYGVGDIFEYEESGGAFGSTRVATWTVGPVRTILGAGLELVAAVPVYRLPEGPDSGGWFLDVTRGGSVLVADACLWSRATCSEPKMMVWGECPFGGPFAPFDSLRRDSVGDRAIVVDPVRGNEWHYDVARLSGDRLEFVLTEGSPRFDTCSMPRRAVVDPAAGLLVESEVHGGVRRLLSATRAGPSFDLLGEPEAKTSFDLRPLEHGIPPGASALVAGDWTLGDAWAVARRESQTLADFLRTHPGSVVADADRSHGESRVATIGSTHAEWTIEVQAPSGDALDVVVRRTAGPLFPSYEVQTRAQAREEPFDPVGAQADLQDFGAALTSLVGPPPLQLSFELGTVNRMYSSYWYLFPVGERADGQIAVYKEHVMLHADAGRLAQAMLTREHAAAFLSPVIES